MEKQKHIIDMATQNLKENIYLAENGMEKKLNLMSLIFSQKNIIMEKLKNIKMIN